MCTYALPRNFSCPCFYSCPTGPFCCGIYMTLDRNIPHGSLQISRRLSSLMTTVCSPRPEIHDWTRRNCSTAGDPVRTRHLCPRRTSRHCTNYRHFTTFNWVKLGHQGLGFRVPMPGPVFSLDRADTQAQQGHFAAAFTGPICPPTGPVAMPPPPRDVESALCTPPPTFLLYCR